jgi:malate synthase
VAHPDLVQIATECFDEVLGERPNQIDRRRDDVSVQGGQLLDVRIPGGAVTEAGVRANVSVGIQYIESWLRGNGAAAINNLMEDAATAEISRSQIWQWVHHRATLREGGQVTPALVQKIEEEELSRLSKSLGEEAFAKGRYDEARELFDRVALAGRFEEFLTLPAYERID